MLSEQQSTPSLGFAELTPKFLPYAEAERHFSPQTIIKYRDCLRQVERCFGPRAVTEYSKDDLLQLKLGFLNRKLSTNRQISILLALKGFLKYAREELELPVLDPDSVRVPRRERKEVGYLTAAEVEQFISTITISRTRGSRPYLPGLRFRTLVETLLGSAMRIGEVLSLNRTDIEFDSGEAKVIGKGRKQRTVFFTDRALSWIRRYLEARTDTHEALFVRQDGKERLSRTDIWRPFMRHRELAGIPKRITPHLLRHTAATQLLFNGCPIGHIKEILGHERLETTCRYYLGLDHRAAKAAHQKYLNYDAHG